jgi:hypothetical protein
VEVRGSGDDTLVPNFEDGELHESKHTLPFDTAFLNIPVAETGRYARLLQTNTDLSPVLLPISLTWIQLEVPQYPPPG